MRPNRFRMVNGATLLFSERVFERVLDRRVALAGRVLVELVQHHELDRVAGSELLRAERLREQGADHEALRELVQAGQVGGGDRPPRLGRGNWGGGAGIRAGAAAPASARGPRVPCHFSVVT